jgi:hypothetical protein
MGQEQQIMSKWEEKGALCLNPSYLNTILKPRLVSKHMKIQTYKSLAKLMLSCEHMTEER